MPFHKAKYFDLPGFKGALRTEEALHGCLWEAEWAFYSSFLAAHPAVEAPKRVRIEAPVLSELFTFSQAKNPVLLLFRFLCATRLGWANFSLDTVFITDDRKDLVDHNDPDYLKQLKHGQITWKWLDQTVLLSWPCYRSLTLPTN